MKQTSQNIQSALNTTLNFSQSTEGADVMKVADISVEINKIPDLQLRYLKAGVAQNQSSLPTSAEVKTFKLDFSESIITFCTGLRNIAEDSKDEKLIALVNHPISYFFRAAKNEFGARGEQVIAGIEEYIKTTLATKVTAANIKTLRDKLDLFVKNKDNATLIKNNKKVLGTTKLAKIDKDATNLIQRITNSSISSLPKNSDLQNGLIKALVIPKDGTQHNAAELTLQNEDGSLFEGQASATDVNAKEPTIYVVNNKRQILIPSHILGKYPINITAIGKVSQTITVAFKKGVVVKLVVVLVEEVKG